MHFYGGGGGVLPTYAVEAAQEPYIETDALGTHYSVDTGYAVGPDTAIEADFMFLNTVGEIGQSWQQFLFEDQEAVGSDAFWARIYVNGAGGLSYNYGTNRHFTAMTSTPMVTNLRYRASIDAFHGTAYLVAGDTWVYETDKFPGVRDHQCSATLKLFSSCGVNGNWAMVRLYSFKIYERGELVRDYVPALQAGRPGLYDLVERGFISNTNPANMMLNYGGDIMTVPDDAYVESDGTACVNTRYLMNPQGRVEIDFAMTSVEDEYPDDGFSYQMRVFGADSVGNAHKAALYVNSVRNFAFSVGDAAYGISTGSAAHEFARHTAIIDAPAKRLVYMTGSKTNWWCDLATYPNSQWFATNFTKTATFPIALFGNCNAASGLSFRDNYLCERSKARIYGAKFSTAGVPVHDYVPCEKGGVPGFYDLVDGSFVTSENVDGLSAGGDLMRIDDDPYVSTPGADQGPGGYKIDTGINPDTDTTVELDYAFLENYDTASYAHWGNADWYIFVARANDSGSTSYFGAYWNKSFLGWCDAGKNYMKVDTTGFTTAPVTERDIRRKIKIDNSTAVKKLVVSTAGWTNTTQTVSDPVAKSYNEYTLKIAANHGSTAGSAPMKIYGFRVWQGASLVRDYVPRIKGGAAGLYDLVGGGFVASTGAPLSCGGAIESVDGSSLASDAYVESFGTNVVSTGYYITPKTRLEVDFALVHVKGQARVISTSPNNKKNMNAELYVQGSDNTSGNLAFGHGDTWAAIGGIRAGDYSRLKGVFDFKAGTYLLGDSSGNLTAAYTATSSLPLVAFAKSAKGDSASRMKLYSLRIFEDDALAHEYLPHCKAGVVGLYDTVTGDVLADIGAGASVKPLKIGGAGWDGSGPRFLIAPRNTGVTRGQGAVSLSAYAPGAVSYRWEANFEPVEGGEDGELSVAWVKKGGTVPYSVTAVFDVCGQEETATVEFDVTHLPDATMMIVR